MRQRKDHVAHQDEVEAIREVVKNIQILNSSNMCVGDMGMCMTRFVDYSKDHLCYRDKGHIGPHCCSCGRCSE